MSDKKNGKTLTLQQLEFCYLYIACKFNGRKAGLAAKYSAKTVDQQVSRLLSNVKIKKKIRELTKKYFIPLGFKVQDVLNELAILGFSDMKDFVEKGSKGQEVQLKDVHKMGLNSRCIKEMEIEDKFVIAQKGKKPIKLQKVKFKLHGKEKSLELLGKHADLFKIEEDKEDEESGDVVLHVEPKDIRGKSASEIARDYSTLLRGLQKGK